MEQKQEIFPQKVLQSVIHTLLEQKQEIFPEKKLQNVVQLEQNQGIFPQNVLQNVVHTLLWKKEKKYHTFFVHTLLEQKPGIFLKKVSFVAASSSECCSASLQDKQSETESLGEG